MDESRSRSGAIWVLLILFILLTAFNWWLSTTSASRWQAIHLRWNYLYHVFFVVIPLLALLLGRSKASAYGLTLRNWRADLVLGLCLAIPLIALPFLADGLFSEIRVKPGVARYGLINALVFQVLFVAFPEELLYRGFFQSELNRVFGRPYRLGVARFGLGLFVAAGLFGIAHLLNPFNPLRGSYGLDWVMFGGTTVLALVLGLVRERTGGLIAVSLLHLGIGLYPKLFVVGPASGSAMLAAWLVAIAVLVLAVRRSDRGVSN